MSLFHKKDTKREVFGQMFTELYPRLVRYATQLLGDGEEARDIVGSVMEQAWKQFEKLEPENRGAWLYTAARNACLNRLKHLQVEATNLEALREATRMDVATDYREHERLLQQAESIARNLPEPTCTVLRLCYYEHKTYREAAEQLGISPDTVKKHISKALRTLREAMTLKGGTDGRRNPRGMECFYLPARRSKTQTHHTDVDFRHCSCHRSAGSAYRAPYYQRRHDSRY